MTIMATILIIIWDVVKKMTDNSAKIYLEHGSRFPYDAGKEFWEGSDSNPPNANDWAHAAARGVLADLLDRRGIKHGFNDVDHDVRAELVQSLSEIIRLALRKDNSENADKAETELFNMQGGLMLSVECLKEFNRWLFSYRVGRTFESWEINDLKQAWQASAERKDKIIEQQAKELKNLRGFANIILSRSVDISSANILSCGIDHNLIDENGNPTKLLSGEKNGKS